MDDDGDGDGWSEQNIQGAIDQRGSQLLESGRAQVKQNKRVKIIAFLGIELRTRRAHKIISRLYKKITIPKYFYYWIILKVKITNLIARHHS